MSSSDELWELKGFPEVVGCPGGDDDGVQVQRAYDAWRETRKIHPMREATELDPDTDRYTATVKGAYYVDEHLVLQQFKCDYQVNPGPWGTPGEVIYVWSGFVPSLDQLDW
ncbi:hypothetical protein GCM10010435_62680 [Winogradskya consettensis]|uniref:Uncharacterized protein n=1 Tax=Winogradskya consettensis TaxID=113560 RepID=A0A919VWS9_9ACTN|nr:hypothetical protein [Actinoplanes consettensis]GIM83214.1 hypothetical protein Aco04nite_85400 [Actinoplanes consettensis]